MTYKKYLSLLIVISISLAMLPSMAFAVDENKEDSKQTEQTEQTEQDKALPKLGESQAPTPEEGFTLIGKVGDVYYEAKGKDSLLASDTIAVILGQRAEIAAPTINDYLVKKYVSGTWTMLEELDSLPSISYIWGDTSTEAKYIISNVQDADYFETYSVDISLNATLMTSAEYYLAQAAILDSDMKLKSEQVASKIESGDYLITFDGGNVYDEYIPYSLSKTLSAGDVFSNCISFVRYTVDAEGEHYEVVNRTLYELLMTCTWYKDNVEQTTESKFKITNDGNNDICVNIHINGNDLGKFYLNVIDALNPVGMISYPPYIEPGPSTNVVLSCAVDSEFNFDSVKYEWSKSNGWNEEKQDYDLFGDVTVGSKYLIHGVTGDTWMRYVCTVTAKVNGRTYKVKEEVVLDLGYFTDKGLIIPDVQVSGIATGLERSFDFYTIIPQQTGKYALDTNAANSYICDENGNLVQYYDENEKTVILNARNKYKVYASNQTAYTLSLMNLIVCDHSCGTKLINASETYSGDKVCQNCEFLIEKGHIIVKPDPQPDPKKEDKKGTSSNTGDTKDMFPFATLLLIAVVGTYLVGSRNNSSLK